MCNPGFSYHTRKVEDRPVTYVVTGKLHNGKRFKLTTASRMHAFGINLWRGSVWVIQNGKRLRLKRVAN
jgi:hypothetical protein